MSIFHNTTDNMQRILDFLYIETFTRIELLQQLLQQNNVQSTYSIINKMIENKYISKIDKSVITGRNIRLYGITRKGLTLVERYYSDETYKRPAFQKSKISVKMLSHKLDIQRFHILLCHSGWKNWIDGSQLGQRDKDQKVPDAITTSPSGIVYALEIEREIKAAVNYPKIIKSHLVSRKAGKWQRIIYLCPTKNMANSLEKKSRKIKSITYQGGLVQLTEKYHELFSFYGYDEFEQKINLNQFQ